MRRVVSLSVLGLAAGMLSGCDLKEVYPTAIPPMAGVRFINAVPDTAGSYGMDLRFVDILESNAHFRQNFRNLPTTAGGVTASAGVQFKHARAGQRRFKIFLDDTLASLATVEIIDTTVTLEAGKNYTAMLWGYANPAGPGRPVGAPAMRLTFFEEAVAAPGTNVAVRVINATATAINAEQYPAAGAPTGTATFTNVAALSAATHLSVTPAQLRFALTPAGGGPATVLFNATAGTNPLALIGAAASTTAAGSTIMDIEALPGTTIAGSAVSIIVFPPSVRLAPRVAQFTNAVATSRRAGSITDLGGGNYRINDCFVTADCLIPDGADVDLLPDVFAPASAAMPIGPCVPDAFGQCEVTITPPTGSLLPAITVLVTVNGANTVDTNANLAAYVAAYNGLGVNLTYSVVGYHSNATFVWDRRPPYVNP